MWQGRRWRGTARRFLPPCEGGSASAAAGAGADSEGLSAGAAFGLEGGFAANMAAAAFGIFGGGGMYTDLPLQSIPSIPLMAGNSRQTCVNYTLGLHL